MKPFCAEEKLKIIKEVISGGESVYSVCRKHSISKVIFYRWLSAWKRSKKNRLSGLENRVRKDKFHPRSLTFAQNQAVLRLVHKNPEYSCHRLAKTLAIGHHGVQNVLKRYSLSTFHSRKAFSLAPYWKRLSVSERVEMMDLYNKGWKQYEICKRFNISKNTFNKWKRRFLEGVKSGENVYANRYLKGSSHPKSLTKLQEEVVLQTVRESPNLSVHKIHQKLAGVVGHHGIQNTLARFGYNFFSKRLAYAREFLASPFVQVAPLYKPEIPDYSLRQLVTVIKNLPKFILVAPSAGISRIAILVTPILIAIFWVRMIFGTANVSPVGLFFASMALFFGLFFLAYSMKYYLSIFTVLRLAQSGGGTDGESESGRA